MKSDSIYILVVAVIACLCLSCEPEQPTTLSSTEKKLVDSIYSRDISYERKLADTECDEMYDVYFQQFADSLKAAYLADIEDIEAYLRNQGYE